MATDLPTTSWSRRHLLSATATAGLAAAATGCQVQTTPDSEPTAGGNNDPSKIKFPDPAAELPTDDVTFRTMMSGGIKQDYFETVWKAFGQEHDNIAMELDTGNWDRIQETIPLGIRNKTAPDIFQMPDNVPVQTAVQEGWVAPLEDVVPDFEDWKQNFPDGAFIPGVHVFDDKTYSWTFTSSRSQYTALMFYDQALMEQAGYDPAADRFSWDTLREAAKTITDQGDGQSYGLMLPGQKIGRLALNLAELAGLSGHEMNFTTGEYNYTDPLLRDAIDLLLAIQSDGSLFPGVMTVDPGDAATQFSQGVAGILFDGAWNIVNWQDAAPDYEYGIAMPPTGNDQAMHHAGYEEGTAAPLFAYADSKYPEITGELFRYMGSVDGQAAMVAMTNGIFTSQIAEANKQAHRGDLVSGPAAKAGEIMEELRVMFPLPQTANPDVAQVIFEQKAVAPDLDDVMQGVFTGQVKNVDQALQDLQDRSDQSLDEAIAAAQKKGAQVSRDDWKFPNWDPEADYATDDYDQR